MWHGLGCHLHMHMCHAGLACAAWGTYGEEGVSGVLQNSALRERVSDFILHREMELNPNSVETSQSHRLSRNTHLGNDDFFFKNFHGIVFAAGLLSDKNHLPKSSLSQELQVVKVAHCLEEISPYCIWIYYQDTRVISLHGNWNNGWI